MTGAKTFPASTPLYVEVCRGAWTRRTCHPFPPQSLTLVARQVGGQGVQGGLQDSDWPTRCISPPGTQVMA